MNYMVKTLASMAESNKNVARSNAPMTEMNEKMRRFMIQTMQKVPGLKP